jgi:uncharacterized OB-fold protein
MSENSGGEKSTEHFYCKNCGAKIFNHAVFCERCGEEVICQ